MTEPTPVTTPETRRSVREPLGDADAAGPARVALITGAGSGLGRATAQVLAAGGMRVVAGDLIGDAADETVASLAADGGEATAVRLDVTDPSSAGRAVDDTLARYPSLDVLVNCAGIDATGPFETIDASVWERVLDVNLLGPARMTRAALPALQRSGRGHVVNIASTAALRAWPDATAYHASKWGLRGLGQALFADLRRSGIRVTTVIAGGMRTPFILDRFPDVPLDVLQDPRNVAAAIRFAVDAPPGTVIAELTVLPINETSWP